MVASLCNRLSHLLLSCACIQCGVFSCLEFHRPKMSLILLLSRHALNTKCYSSRNACKMEGLVKTCVACWQNYWSASYIFVVTHYAIEERISSSISLPHPTRHEFREYVRPQCLINCDVQFACNRTQGSFELR